MFQTWPSHDAYMADVAWQNQREEQIRRWSLEKCVHGQSLTAGCDKCGDLVGKTCTRPVSSGEVTPDQVCGEQAFVAMVDVVPYLVENRDRWEEYLADLAAGASSPWAARGLVAVVNAEREGHLCEAHYEESRLTWK